MNNKVVGLLGPKSTFSDLAAHQHYANKGISDFLYLASIAEVFDAVNDGVVEEGIVPVENSVSGPVEQFKQNYSDSKFKIVDRFSFEICHALVTFPNAKKEDITAIVSQEEVLKQCSKYLGANFPGVQLIASPSTIAGLESIKEQEAKNAAAIIPLETAAESGLQIVEKDIGNASGSTTFAVIKKAA